MNLRFVPFEEGLRSEWDRFYETNPHAWPGQHSSTIDYETALGSASFCRLIVGPQDELVGIVPLFLKRTRRGRVRELVSGGAGLRGGFLLVPSVSANRKFWPVVADWLRKLAGQARIDRIRLPHPHFMGDQMVWAVYPCHPLLEQGFVDSPSLNMFVDLEQSVEDLFGNLSASCRNDIRFARKAGVELRPVTTRSGWLECFALNQSTYAAEARAAFSMDSMERIWDGFISKGMARALCAHHEGRRIAVVTTVGTSFAQYYWHSFSLRPRPIRGVNSLLLFESINWARANGHRWFEMGRLTLTPPRQRAISRFKQQFCGYTRYGLSVELHRRPIKQAALNLASCLMNRLPANESTS